MITQNELKEVLHYNPNTGDFTWIKKTCIKVVAGKLAGTVNDRGYVIITINKKLYRAHRLAWFYMTGNWPKDQIDHKNHIRNDNRWDNLRETTNQGNSRNISLNPKNKTGVTGVYWVKKDKRWRSYIYVSESLLYLGSFIDKFEAICARMSANNKHGYHENHGR